MRSINEINLRIATIQGQIDILNARLGELKWVLEPSSDVTVPTGTVPTPPVPTGPVPTATIPTTSVPTAVHTPPAVPTLSGPTGPVPTPSVPTAVHTPAVPTPSVPTATIPTGPITPGGNGMMQISGKKMLDANGNPFLSRGIEQLLGNQIPVGNNWVQLITGLANTGANSVRCLFGIKTLKLADCDAVLNVVRDRKMVAYVTTSGGDMDAWFSAADTKAMLAKHNDHIIIDAAPEPSYDDRDLHLSDSKAVIAKFRGWGYKNPLTIGSNHGGRDLRSVLINGAAILASDPLKQIVFGTQMYWGKTGWSWAAEQNFTDITDAMTQLAADPWCHQIGIDVYTDGEDRTTAIQADYQLLMTLAQQNKTPWLYWDFFNPYGTVNNLSNDGTATNLTSFGNVVVNTHPASIKNTAKPRT